MSSCGRMFRGMKYIVMAEIEDQGSGFFNCVGSAVDQ